MIWHMHAWDSNVDNVNESISGGLEDFMSSFFDEIKTYEEAFCAQQIECDSDLSVLQKIINQVIFPYPIGHEFDDHIHFSVWFCTGFLSQMNTSKNEAIKTRQILSMKWYINKKVAK